MFSLCLLVYNLKFFPERDGMQEINPITHHINDLKGRCLALRGYL